MSTVLLIEPDGVLARLYSDALTADGHEVYSAGTAQDAIDTADEHLPDVIILELQLPAHNGVAFLHELRSYAEWQAVPVVINSYTPPSELAAAKQTLTADLGVAAMLYKPRTSIKKLLGVVQYCVGSGT